MERKDTSGILPTLAVIDMIVLLIIGFATESYLNTPSLISGDDNSVT